MSTSIRTLLRASFLGLILTVFCVIRADAQQSAEVTGIITDAQDGTSLPYANVVLMQAGTAEMYVGSSTDDDGRYHLESVEPGRYVLSVSYVGYETQLFEFAVAAGVVRTLNIALERKATALQPIIITATPVKRQKKVDAPVSVAVVRTEEIEREVGTSPAEVLRTVPGVDIARTGIDRREIVVRGFNNAFSGGAHVMTDYRQSAIASLGVNAYSMMPISSIDLDRIEVLRGPAGALYGPGVDDGVIHFITKDPFEYPGTTVALTAGQQAMLGAQIRHAGTIRGRLGYKINGLYLEANDWALDPLDPHDKAIIDAYHSVTPRMEDVNKVNLSGTVAYEFGPSTTLTAGAGYGSATSVFLSDIGALQSDGFGYRYGQLRLQSGRFFAQAYLNVNDTGDSFVYAGPGVASSLSGESVVDKSTQLNLQAQHGFNLFGDREHITVGVDFERTNPVTDGTITGRNEGEDLILEYGAYVQSETELSEKLSLTVAGRLDYDNIFEQLQLSPRAAVIYKPRPEHALRATFNRAFASPSTNSLFLDLIAREASEQLPFTVRARGAVHGFTFGHNPAYPGNTDLVASSLNPAMLGAPQPVGLPLDQVYASIYDALSNTSSAVIQQELARAGIVISEPEVDWLKQMLSPDAGTNVQGFSQGSLGILNLTTQQMDPVTEVTDIAPLKQSTTQTFELGYNGSFGQKLAVAVDGYYTVKTNFVRGLRLETPFVFVPQLRPDITAAMAAGIEGNEQLAEALAAKGLSPAAAAAFIATLADPWLPQPTGPVAMVQPDENNPGVGESPELMLSYRNFGRVAFYGFDVSTQLELNERTNLFGALSYVSDNFFDHEEVDEANPDLFVALNASAFKVGAGFSHRIPRGLSFNLNGRYSEGFTVRSGPFNGDIEDVFLLDAGAGFDFDRYAPGLRLDVTVQNILDREHREFIGAPKMGRLGIARLTYTL